MKISLGPWIVRPLHDTDIEAMVRYGNNRNVWKTLRDRFPHPYTPAHAKAFLETLRNQNPQTHFAIASTEELIGVIGVSQQSDVYRVSAEIGYWLGEPFWGQGIATRAVRGVTGWAFATLGVERVYADVFETNPASRRVLEKAGYSCEGTLRHAAIKEGRLIDVWLMATYRPS
jgi:RimJ/RimL family protein N-acetyltransferase